jgi:hypothetical protein
MSAAVYSRLLDGFRQGWVESGHALFNVEIRSPGSFARVGVPGLDTVDYQTEEVIASAFLLYTADSNVEESSEAVAVVKRAEWRSQELIDKFKSLVREAGAALPLAIRDRLPRIDWMTRNPQSRWVTLLAYLHGFTVYDTDGRYQEKQFITNPGNRRRYQYLVAQPDLPRYWRILKAAARGRSRRLRTPKQCQRRMKAELVAIQTVRLTPDSWGHLVSFGIDDYRYPDLEELKRSKQSRRRWIGTAKQPGK